MVWVNMMINRCHTQWLSLFTSIAEGKIVFNSFIYGSLLTSYGFHIISFLLWSSYNIYIYFPELGIIYRFQARNLSPTLLEQLKTPKLRWKWLHIWLMRYKQIQSVRFGISNERGSIFEGGGFTASFGAWGRVSDGTVCIRKSFSMPETILKHNILSC